MTLNDYQKAAERTSGDLTSWDKVRNGCYGLNGEAGECIDILKKTEFQGHAFDPMKMVDELGDVLWYVAQLATGLGVTLEYVAQHNVDIIKRGHEAVIEHGSLTVRFICDRGVSHEIVRHRLAAFCQESTRYCNYGKEGFGGEITVIRPSTFAKTDSTYHIWKRSCEHAEVAYFDLLNEGCTPQEARSVLPNSLKTEVVMTADLREWRHFCRMRCPVAAHPDMRVVANMLLTLLKQTYPVFFEDIEV